MMFQRRDDRPRRTSRILRLRRTVLRNYISNLSSSSLRSSKPINRKINEKAGADHVRQGIEELKKFQAGSWAFRVSTITKMNCRRVSGLEMFGCCAPERHESHLYDLTNIIDKLPESKLGPAGIYVT